MHLYVFRSAPCCLSLSPGLQSEPCYSTGSPLAIQALILPSEREQNAQLLFPSHSHSSPHVNALLFLMNFPSNSGQCGLFGVISKKKRVGGRYSSCVEWGCTGGIKLLFVLSSASPLENENVRVEKTAVEQQRLCASTRQLFAQVWMQCDFGCG